MKLVLIALSQALLMMSFARADPPNQTGYVDAPYLEWTLDWRGASDNPYDVIASAEFTHPDGTKVRTPMFYGGNDQWRFRFTGTRVGTWKLRTEGPGDLGGHGATAEIMERPGEKANGFMTHFGSKWGWQGTQKAFIPQYVMGKNLDAYYNHGDVHIKSRIKMYATFFRDRRRFHRDLVRDNTLADPYEGTTETPDAPPISVCLRAAENDRFIFYKEQATAVGMDLSHMKGPAPGVAVDARRVYQEIDLGWLTPKKQKWSAPYSSDWAIAVGRFE